MMKKFLALSLVVVMMFSFCACSGSRSASGDAPDTTVRETFPWPEADWFDKVPKYQHGDIVYAKINSASTVSVSNTSYEDFLSYVEKLKKSGFTYYDNTGSAAEENTQKNKDGLAMWVCTDGDIYLSLIYIDPACGAYKQYRCNVRIYAYDSKPTSWQ